MDGVTGFEVLFFIGWLGFIPYHSPPFLWFLRLESIPSNTTDMLHPLTGIFIAFTIFYIMLFLLNNNGFFFPSKKNNGIFFEKLLNNNGILVY